MTKDQATKVVNDYKDLLRGFGTALAMESLAFGLAAREAEAPLGLHKGALFQALVDVRLLDAVSAYIAVLENATKGQLAPVTVDDEWSEVISDEGTH